MCLLYMEKKHICVNVYGGNSRTTLKEGLKFKNCGGDGFHFNFFLLQNTSNCTHINLRNSLDRRSRHTFTIATAQRKYINTRAAQRRKHSPQRFTTTCSRAGRCVQSTWCFRRVAESWMMIERSFTCAKIKQNIVRK
jgi:hypothetical protein